MFIQFKSLKHPKTPSLRNIALEQILQAHKPAYKHKCEHWSYMIIKILCYHKHLKAHFKTYAENSQQRIDLFISIGEAVV